MLKTFILHHTIKPSILKKDTKVKTKINMFLFFSLLQLYVLLLFLYKMYKIGTEKIVNRLWKPLTNNGGYVRDH